MNRKILVLLALALTGVALLAAGCGGDNKSADTETTLTATSETETTTEATETTTETTETTEATETTTTTTDTGGGNFSSGECQQFQQALTNFSAATSGTASANLQKAADEFQKFADAAPSAIKSDVETLADVVKKYAAALKGVSPTSPEAAQKLQQLATQINVQKVTQASQNVTTWLQQNCT
jgi:hypothetical protein